MPTRHANPDPGSTDSAFEVPEIQLQPGARYAASTRHWQGIPSIERAATGRLWVTWYSGGQQEDNDNYVLLASSDDDGASWQQPAAVIDPAGMTRAWDPCLWHDPSGRLWWTWAQSCPMRGQAWDGRGGVWASIAAQSGAAHPDWTTPRRLWHGVALNKPIVTRSGAWLLPVALWWFFDQFAELAPYRKPGVLASTDQGETWHWRGSVEVDERSFDEPMIVERQDGTLWMLIRTRTGIAESFSMDDGVSWSRARPSMLAGPSSRFHLRRLPSGRLLLINHLGNPMRQRSHLTALLSEDDGQSWPHRLLLDEREGVSYPDAVAGDDGRLWIVYDYQRFAAREILLAKVTEADIIAGRLTTASAQLRMLVDKAGT